MKIYLLLPLVIGFVHDAGASRISGISRQLFDVAEDLNDLEARYDNLTEGFDRGCDVCHLRYHHKDVATATSFDPYAATSCKQYASSACCTVETANNVHNDVLYGEDYRWDRCGALSDACQAYFVAEACFYECDVNAGKWRKHQTCDGDNQWQMEGMPIKASYCDAWYEACKTDNFCGSGSYFEMATCNSTDSAECKPIGEIYANGKELCEVMWDGAFAYEADEEHAYVMDFEVGSPNPNNDVHPDKPFPEQCHEADSSDCFETLLDIENSVVALEEGHSDLKAEFDELVAGFDVGCDVCHLRYYHKDVATATSFDPNEATACKQYASSSCCTVETASNVHNDELYGADYRWDRCGALSDACQAYFVAEACFYECDVNAGKWRKHQTCDGDNQWQMEGMPIKASYCDAWYEACKTDNFCGSGSYFEMATCNSTDSAECKPIGEIYANGKELCEVMWDGAFAYEADEEHAYVMDFEVGSPNPNNDVHPNKPFPEQCHEANSSDCFETLLDIENSVVALEEGHSDLKAEFDELVAGFDRGCDVCHLRYYHKDVATATSFDPYEATACKQYASSSCCTVETASNVHNDELYGADYRWDRCGALSDACQAYFVAEACFYECDVNAGKWRKHQTCDGDNQWQVSGLVASLGCGARAEMEGMPIKASYCDAWYEACKTDNFCGSGSYFEMATCNSTDSAECKPIGEIYANGKELCEVMWDGAFAYEADEEHAYVMDFEVGSPNPNNDVHPNKPFPEQCHEADSSDCFETLLDIENSVVALEEGHSDLKAEFDELVAGFDVGCDVCHLRYYHKDVATATSFDPNEATACKQYASSSCCTVETASNVHNDELYGADYRWDRCGALSDACQAYFVAEACFYECDVNAGKWRKHQTCDGDNQWQVSGLVRLGCGARAEMEGMPIKASYCDAWYEACKTDNFCGSGSYFEMATCNSTDSAECKPIGEIYANGKELCEVMWDGAFAYEADEEHAYVMDFEVGSPNPNNDVHPNKPFPEQCHEADSSDCFETLLDIENSVVALEEGHSDLKAEFDELVAGFDVGCDVCHLRYYHKDVATATSFDPNEATACKQYASSSCCTVETASNVHNDELYGADYRWDRWAHRPHRWLCFWGWTALLLVVALLFYDDGVLWRRPASTKCDVNAGKWRRHQTCDGDNQWQMEGMPIKASYCDAWYEACKTDNFCGSGSYFEMATCNSTDSAECKPIGEIYANGKELCEVMWDGAFAYEADEEHAYVMDFEVGSPNPNNDVHPNKPFPEQCHEADSSDCFETLLDIENSVVALEEGHSDLKAEFDELVAGFDVGCDVCHLRYYHKDVATATSFDPNEATACKQYASSSCCTVETASNVHNDELYGADYRWDRCGALSDACQAYFVAEACFYECDVNAGKWRKHQTCDGDNQWQMEGMPIKASYCDAWYEACKTDNFCGSGSYFEMATCNSTDSAECKPIGEIYANGKELCEVMWDGAFAYEADEEHAYVMDFEVGSPNPNNDVHPNKPFPEQCHEANSSDCFETLLDVETAVVTVDAQVSELQAENMELQAEVAALQAAVAEDEEEEDDDYSGENMELQAEVAALQAAVAEDEEEDDDDYSETTNIAIAALIIAILGLLLGVVALFKASQAVSLQACMNPRNDHHRSMNEDKVDVVL
ncbi:hypothetical protein CYMTET_49004 [Cymbomonas tetramitiformis]|uniref:Folate receptor-like domain-containing protein n=1 Tax=Cymbomonas tetramitiformis TaxID=36881 RepID=A0AAE0BSC4_9CHLO|nr:hypothetical protein CYMTET_49004 [Cymbomonas tetramitiformis]